MPISGISGFGSSIGSFLHESTTAQKNKTDTPTEPPSETSQPTSQEPLPENNSSNESSESSSSEETSQKEESAQKNEEDLSQSEKAQIAKLQQRDAEVRAHEAAHMAAAGGIATGGASFTYQTGPDGKQYAVGGEVSISVAGGDTPEETIANMQQVRAAALAPSDPSPQDLKVAATAAMMESRARSELSREQNEERTRQAEAGASYEENSRFGQEKSETDTSETAA